MIVKYVHLKIYIPIKVPIYRGVIMMPYVYMNNVDIAPT